MKARAIPSKKRGATRAKALPRTKAAPNVKVSARAKKTTARGAKSAARGPKAGPRAKAEHTTGQAGYRELRKQVLLRFEIDFVWKLLKASHGNISLAARTARIDRKHFWRLIKRTGIRVERL